MASPISFGDAYLMGKLALQIGRAFTKGRKSAPSEFREVENQLYSLSSALCALKDAPASNNATGAQNPHYPQSGQTGTEDAITVMLHSCEETLGHLKAIVDKYSCMVEQRDSQEPKFKRWSRDIKSNWKRIAWTKEGGDLATLRSQLTVHTNSLSLVLGVAVKYVLFNLNIYLCFPQKLFRHCLTCNSSQTNRIEDRVEQIDAMLREIHLWFSTNLKATTSSNSSTVESGIEPGDRQLNTLNEIVFQLYLDSGQEDTSQLICPRASLLPKWRLKAAEDGARHLFICRCTEDVHGATDSSHYARVAAYACKSV